MIDLPLLTINKTKMIAKNMELLLTDELDENSMPILSHLFFANPILYIG